MIIKENESLAEYTTFRMGGLAKTMYFPESVEELRDLLEQKEGIKHYIIGGGSNLLINDRVDFEQVLCMRNCNTEMKSLGAGVYYAGAGVRLQKLIQRVNEDGYGGIEYLFSVPGLVGGAVYMNAGRGQKYNRNISDYIERVDYFFEGKLQSKLKNDCDFSYRHSCFHNMDGAIITGVEFHFEEMAQEESKKQRQERIELCRKQQDMSFPNFGTVFCFSNAKIMHVIKKLGLGSSKGVHFSKKTANWMLKGPEGTYQQTKKLLKKVTLMHKIFGKKCVTEVRMWDE